jgi:hypothetical protein
VAVDGLRRGPRDPEQVRRKSLRRSRNWAAIIDRLNRSPRGELRIKMGSPGSAQVTRCRLLAEWSNLEATTVGSTLYLRLARRG